MKTLKLLFGLCVMQLVIVACLAMRPSVPVSDGSAPYSPFSATDPDPSDPEGSLIDDPSAVSDEGQTGINYAESGTMADFRIVSGIPQYTRDGGATWEELPVSADLLQNEWQDYLKMGPQSYIITGDQIILAYTGVNGDAKLLVGDAQKTWEQVGIDLNGQQALQMSLSQDAQGIYRLPSWAIFNPLSAVRAKMASTGHSDMPYLLQKMYCSTEGSAFMRCRLWMMERSCWCIIMMWPSAPTAAVRFIA